MDDDDDAAVEGRGGDGRWWRRRWRRRSAEERGRPAPCRAYTAATRQSVLAACAAAYLVDAVLLVLLVDTARPVLALGGDGAASAAVVLPAWPFLLVPLLSGAGVAAASATWRRPLGALADAEAMLAWAMLAVGVVTHDAAARASDATGLAGLAIATTASGPAWSAAESSAWVARAASVLCLAAFMACALLTPGDAWSSASRLGLVTSKAVHFGLVATGAGGGAHGDVGWVVGVVAQCAARSSLVVLRAVDDGRAPPPPSPPLMPPTLMPPPPPPPPLTLTSAAPP
jgi:hypothetical protein